MVYSKQRPYVRFHCELLIRICQMQHAAASDFMTQRTQSEVAMPFSKFNSKTVDGRLDRWLVIMSNRLAPPLVFMPTSQKNGHHVMARATSSFLPSQVDSPMNAAAGSVTILLNRFRSGDETALNKLFDRFFERLRTVARKRIPVRDRKVVDDEDLAVWAMNTFQQCVRDGKYKEIGDRNDLWKFLVSILDRKSIDHLRKQHAEKRGGGNVRGESVFEDQDRSRAIEKFFLQEKNIEVIADFHDAVQSICQRLDDPGMAEIVAAKMAGFTYEEIAKQIGKSVSSVVRKLRLVRNIIAEDQDFGFRTTDID